MKKLVYRNRLSPTSGTQVALMLMLVCVYTSAVYAVSKTSKTATALPGERNSNAVAFANFALPFYLNLLAL